MIKHNNYSQKKIETIFSDLGYKIRYEKGNFQSGYCMVENTSIVVINKFYDTEARVNCLIDILDAVDVNVELLAPKSLEFYKKVLKTIEKRKQTELFEEEPKVIKG